MKRILFLFLLIPAFPLVAADSAMQDAERVIAGAEAHLTHVAAYLAPPVATPVTDAAAEQLYNPRGWIAVKTLTPGDILFSLGIINTELAETQAKLDHLSDQIPQNKKVAIDALLAKWCTDAQAYMKRVQHESKLEGAEKFMTAYERQEAVIAAQVAEIERLMQSAQVAENELDDLMGALSLNGQVTDDTLIGDLEHLSLGD